VRDPHATREEGLEAFYAGRWAEAHALLAVAADAGDADAAFHLGACLERLGDLEGADAALALAADLDPEGFVPPCRISPAEFDRVVTETLDELPAIIRGVLEEHCTLLREDYPHEARVRREGVDPLLLGECIGSLESARLGDSGPIQVASQDHHPPRGRPRHRHGRGGGRRPRAGLSPALQPCRSQ
jgi:hypothetical protein